MSFTTNEDLKFSWFAEFPMDSITGRFPSPSAVITDKCEGMFLIIDDFFVGISSEVFLVAILPPKPLLFYIWEELRSSFSTEAREPFSTTSLFLLVNGISLEARLDLDTLRDCMLRVFLLELDLFWKLSLFMRIGNY